MEGATLLGRIDEIKDDPTELAKLQCQLQARLESLTATIKARLTAETVSSLLLDLTHREVHRVNDPSGMEISDFAGQSQFLRALCATVPLDTFAPADDPQTDDLLDLCVTAWRCMSYRELVESLKAHVGDGRDLRAMFAGMMTLVTAIQGDLMSDDDCNQRVRRLFGPFSTDVFTPQLGVNVEQVIMGFTGVRELLKSRIQHTFVLMRPLIEMWQEFNQLLDSGDAPPTVEEYHRQNPTMQNSRERFKQGIEVDRSLLIYEPAELDEYVNGKGREFLEVFSFTPGKVNQDVTTLFDDDVVRRRPFGRLSDKEYVLFGGLRCAFAPLHRLPECFTTTKQRHCTF